MCTYVHMRVCVCVHACVCVCVCVCMYISVFTFVWPCASMFWLTCEPLPEKNTELQLFPFIESFFILPVFCSQLLFVGCSTSQQQASVSQGRICSDYFTCCHTEIEVADQTFYLTHSQYTDTGPTSPSADPITPGAWQGSHWRANV